MKKLTNTIWIALVAATCGITTTSCKDFFDVEPENGQKTADYYGQANDLNGAALGLYPPLAENIHKLFLWGSARADMVRGGSGANAYITEFVNNKVTGINPYTDYSFLYQTIARCNHHLKNLPRMKPTQWVDSLHLEIFYGEAYFMRALSYYYLVRTFHDVPLVLDDISEEVAFTTSEGKEIRLKTLELSEEEIRAIALQPAGQQKVWEAISSDLNKALALVPSVAFWYPPYGDRTWLYNRTNLPAVYTLACEVALWLGEYERASALADYLFVYKSVGGMANWITQFTGNGDGTYACFYLAYQYPKAYETNLMQQFTSNRPADGGEYFVAPAVDVLDQLFPDTKDIRRLSWMMVNREPVIWKYIGKDEKGLSMRDAYQSDAPWHIFKAVDGYLLKAIAENRLGNPKGSLLYLNLIRRNRGLEEYKDGSVSLQMESIEDKLFLERARETAFEGRRWYDLMLLEKMGRTGVLAESVSRKYPAAEQPAMKAYLSDQAHWYLPVDPERWSKVEN